MEIKTKKIISSLHTVWFTHKAHYEILTRRWTLIEMWPEVMERPISLKPDSHLCFFTIIIICIIFYSRHFDLYDSLSVRLKIYPKIRCFLSNSFNLFFFYSKVIIHNSYRIFFTFRFAEKSRRVETS